MTVKLEKYNGWNCENYPYQVIDDRGEDIVPCTFEDVVNIYKQAKQIMIDKTLNEARDQFRIKPSIEDEIKQLKQRLDKLEDDQPVPTWIDSAPTWTEDYDTQV